MLRDVDICETMFQNLNHAINGVVNPEFSDAPRYVGGVATLAVFDAGQPSSEVGYTPTG